MLGVTTKLRNVCFSKKQLLASWNALTNAEGVLSSSLLFLLSSSQNYGAKSDPQRQFSFCSSERTKVK